MSKTIRVTGNGSLSLDPNLTTITMRMSKVVKDYKGAVNDSRDKTEELKNMLEKAGFNRKDLKTRVFNINTEYKSYKKGDNWYEKFEGYRYYEELILEFDTNNATLTKAINAITKSEADLNFSINYSVKEKEEAKDKLLKICVNDAIRKGEIIANASGLTITGVSSVDYSWKEIDFRLEKSDFSVCNNMVKVYGGNFDIEPENINIEDTVMVIFEAE